jgi:hypothetical protein
VPGPLFCLPDNNGAVMSVFEIVVEPRVRRRRVRQPLSGKKRAAALFRVWHGLRDMIEEAERLGDGELVHFLAVAQMMIEEKVAAVTSGIAIGFAEIDSSLPN